MEEQKISNKEALCGLIIIGCTVYGAAELARIIGTGVAKGSIWAGEKIINAFKKKNKSR